MLVKEKLTMVKKVLLCFMLGVATISSGCGKQVSSEKSNVVDMLESDDSKVKDTFPDTYNAESESGKVKFNCTLELPENMNTRTIQKTTVEGVHSYDKDKAYSLLAEGKEISNKDNMMEIMAKLSVIHFLMEQVSI